MTVDFSGYLEAICNNPKYTQWWETYTVTDVVGKEISKPRNDSKTRSPFLLDLDLKVQTVPKKEERENREEEKEKIERLGVLEGLRKYAANHVLLRGKPGSGKSTALVRLLLEDGDLARSQKAKGKSSSLSCGAIAQKEDNIKIPVLVELRSYKTSVLDSIQNFLSQNKLNVNTSDLETLLKEGKLLLLVDGVNELPSDAAYQDLQQFKQQYSKTPMIFTTRELGLRGDLNIEKKLTMEPLTEPQMRQFVKGYFEYYKLPEQEAEAMLKQLGGRIKKLEETPLLLWMLCSVFVQNEQIPDNLGEVFRVFTTWYDKEFKKNVSPRITIKSKADPSVSKKQIEKWPDVLQYLAFEMTKRKNEPVISKAEAQEILGEFLTKLGAISDPLINEVFLEDLLNYHLLQERGQDDIEFRHQLIQEYYAAETLVLEFDKLTDEQLQWDYLNYLKWTEPMAVVAGLLREKPQAVRLVKLGLAVDLQLGARLSGEVNDTFQGETVDLVKKLEIPALYKVELLGRTKSDKAIESLEKALNDSDYYIRKEAVSILEEIGSKTFTESFISDLNNNFNYSWGNDPLSDLEEVAVILASNKGVFLKESQDLIIALLTLRRWIMMKASQAISKSIFSKADIKQLISGLNDYDWNIRVRTANILGEIGSQIAILPLNDYLLHNDRQYLNHSFSDILKALETIQDKCQIYQTLCLPFLKIPQNSLISDTKLTEYCLKYKQNYDKSRQLTQAGFTLSNPQQLKQTIQQIINQNIVSQHQENDYGILYHVKGELNSINDEKLTIITVWLKRKIDQKIQLISLKIISDDDENES
ncbi:NACHT domain-containing NTPase [Cyanothece sp. BG0011]|uniref:NACHT domain-containing protein n=1 Tax=Cyanothece sp. BG0011 TaxID=2082950 RepID=UPI000D1F370E|nr:DUF6883 domain-containing protein [Cyanothece sp. BG0011]